MQQGITAEQFERAVVRSELGVTGVAKLLGLSRDRIYSYMRDGVTKANRAEQVRHLMGLWLTAADPYGPFSDDQLLREIQKRLAELRARTPADNEQLVGDSGPGNADIPKGRDGINRIKGTGGPPREQ